MIEGTRRDPHTRTYSDGHGRTSYIEVDDHGCVSITEELLDQLLRASGLTETTNDEDSK